MRSAVFRATLRQRKTTITVVNGDNSVCIICRFAKSRGDRRPGGNETVFTRANSIIDLSFRASETAGFHSVVTTAPWPRTFCRRTTVLRRYTHTGDNIIFISAVVVRAENSKTSPF